MTKQLQISLRLIGKMIFLFKNYGCESFNLTGTVERVELLFIFVSFEGFCNPVSTYKNDADSDR